ncbi:MAG: hypothetical protein LC730_06735, partial [Acidobacteria bacterium]|nr:hypothetical protein [Acidobacteriota bacterium]
NRNLTIARHKKDAMNEVFPIICAIRNGIEKREFFDAAVQRFRIDDSKDRDYLWRQIKKATSANEGEVKKLVACFAKNRLTVVEERLLDLLIYDTELRDMILPQLEETDYEFLATASIFRALYSIQKRGSIVSSDVLAPLVGDDDFALDFIPLLMMSEPKRAEGEIIDSVLHEAENCVFTLRSMAISNRILEVSQQLILAEQGGEQARVNQLVNEHLELSRLKRDLISKIVET